jgi:sugar lactone lactonase YvrE
MGIHGDSTSRRSTATLARLAAISLPLLAVLSMPNSAADPAFPPLIALPDGFSPEGIETGRGSRFYVGNLAGGDLLRGDYRTGIVETLAPSPGPGASAAGLKIDPRTNHLFVSAITFGARVYDAGTGALRQAYPFTTPGPFALFINDVVVTRDAAFFTDSCSTTLFKLPLGPGGRLPDPSAVQALALTGEFEFVPIPYPGGAYPCYPNMNGIAATDNGQWLIVNNTATERLYRVDPRTGASVQIEILNAPFATPFTDGLLLHGTTLYSVENFMNRIAVIELSQDLLTGTIARYIESPSFDVPTTAAFFGSAIYAVNARFRADGSVPPEVDDDVVRVSR